ncbi:hypothetical protein [Caldimonas sp. KR1-144]|uniref:hypothetical protein n=1 Tax=Caldimonas sp. KR1-144 TaxID=3400911 RepID=UPI003C077093
MTTPNLPEDQEREAFEAWCMKRWAGDRDALTIRGDGEYHNGHVQFAWCAFQAGRAAAEALRAVGAEPVGHLHSNGDFCQDRQVLSDSWPIPLYAAPPRAVPQGWKLVPVEPTEEMLAAADEGDREYTLRNFGDIMTVQQGPYDHWVAMLSAAPSPKEQGESV